MKCAHCDRDVEIGWKLCSKCSDRMVDGITGLFQQVNPPAEGSVAIPAPGEALAQEWGELTVAEEGPSLITSGPNPAQKTRALTRIHSERDIMERNILADQVEAWLNGD